MLVLGRKAGEAIYISGQIKVTVVRITGNSVKVGIDAPEDVRIIRGELDDWSELSFDAPRPLEPSADDCQLPPSRLTCL